LLQKTKNQGKKQKLKQTDSVFFLKAGTLAEKSYFCRVVWPVWEMLLALALRATLYSFHF
jgi:hypothetical protein